jgi:hypothetical protein
MGLPVDLHQGEGGGSRATERRREWPIGTILSVHTARGKGKSGIRPSDKALAKVNTFDNTVYARLLGHLHPLICDERAQDAE